MYPFGLSHNQNPNRELNNKYLYNGKELNDELGLKWYHYGSRYYDPALARWSVVDPASSKYSSLSPYSYAFNNPIIFLDPDGEDPIDFLNGVVNAVVTNHHPTQSGRGLGAPAAGSVARADYESGQRAGDYVSLVVGLAETLIGGTKAVAGVAGAPETLGASLVLTAEGAIWIGEGLNVINNAKNSLAENDGKVNANRFKNKDDWGGDPESLNDNKQKGQTKRNTRGQGSSGDEVQDNADQLDGLDAKRKMNRRAVENNEKSKQNLNQSAKERAREQNRRNDENE